MAHETERQDSEAAEAIRSKELLNVSGYAWVFSAGAGINGQLVSPDAGKDALGLKNAHLYRHASLGTVVAFALDYQDIANDTLTRYGWQLDPYLPEDPEKPSYYIELDGRIGQWVDDASDSQDDDGQRLEVIGNARELELVGPAPVCFKCELVHPEGDERAHQERNRYMAQKLDGLLGEGWDRRAGDGGSDEADATSESSIEAENDTDDSIRCASCGSTYDRDSVEAARHKPYADYQVMTMPHGRKPDWAAGRAQINGLRRTPMRDWPNAKLWRAPDHALTRYKTTQEFWADSLLAALQAVERAWKNKSQHFMRLDNVRDADILICGAYRADCYRSSLGNELAANLAVRQLEISGVSRTVGFDD